MLDSHLAELYEVPTKRLNEAVRRNRSRFPDDFMFQLTEQECQGLVSQTVIPNLRSQIATSSYGGRRYLPYVFTEQGVAMLSTVLNSERAIAVNIAIMRAFVRLRQILATNKELLERVLEMERKYNKQFRVIFEILEKMVAPPQAEPEPSKSPMGFTVPEKKKKAKQ